MSKTKSELVSPLVAFSDSELAELNARFESLDALQIIEWAVELFGADLCLTSSMSEAVLIDLALAVSPDIEVIFIDTQYHFPETLQTLAIVENKYQPNLKVVRGDFEMDDLWMLDTDTCCDRRKVQQLNLALIGKTAWMSGLRRADSPERSNAPIVSIDRRGLVKINPIATWSDDDLENYVREHDVPVNALLSKGYPSIGCWPCTSKVAEGEDIRTGRWASSAKTECGLHL